VCLSGAKPVFADVCRGTWLIDPASVAAVVTARTVGVIGVHLYGQPVDANALSAFCERRGLWLMEDSAQAHMAEFAGKRTGNLGVCAAFSFYPGKNLGAPGEGGAVVTNSRELATRVRQLRDHGQTRKYHHEILGCNARMPAVMAAALQVKLPILAGWNAARRQHAGAYCSALAGDPLIELPVEHPAATGVYHLFVVHVPRRDQIYRAMADGGVGCGLHYPVPCHLQPCFEYLEHRPGDFPVSEYNAAHCLSLPMYPELSDEQRGQVVRLLSEAVRH
jgi:dTDP-4-amino-4,6-dideoxygalactose transaminase